MDKLDKKLHINFWYIIAAMLGMLLIQNFYIESTRLTPIPYSRFQTLLDEDKIAKIAIAQNYISGSLKEAAPHGLKEFITTRVDPNLAQTLNKRLFCATPWRLGRSSCSSRPTAAGVEAPSRDPSAHSRVVPGAGVGASSVGAEARDRSVGAEVAGQGDVGRLSRTRSVRRVIADSRDEDLAADDAAVHHSNWQQTVC